MSLQEIISADIKASMLARQSDRTGVLRMLQSEIKNSQINLGHSLTDDEIIAVVRKEIKKRTESASLYTQHGQPDRAAAETTEAEILQAYLPAAISHEELTNFLKAEIEAHGGTFSPALRGVLIKSALAKFGNQTDGRQINQAIDSL
jgi:hypothetical protein